MSDSIRDRTVTQVTGLLAQRFPGVSRRHVTETVAAEYDALDGNPIRMYVLNLVEHAARSRLRQEGRPAH